MRWRNERPSREDHIRFMRKTDAELRKENIMDHLHLLVVAKFDRMNQRNVP